MKQYIIQIYIDLYKGNGAEEFYYNEDAGSIGIAISQACFKIRQQFGHHVEIIQIHAWED